MFPEQIEAALAGVLGVEALLVVGVPDPQWGQKLVGLVRPSKQSAPPTLLAELERAADQLPPAERPKQWVIRNDLTTNHQDKWERSRWAQKFGETAEA